MLADLYPQEADLHTAKTLYTGLVIIVKLHARACVFACVTAYEKSFWEEVSRKNWNIKWNF